MEESFSQLHWGIFRLSIAYLEAELLPFKNEYPLLPYITNDNYSMQRSSFGLIMGTLWTSFTETINLWKAVWPTEY